MSLSQTGELRHLCGFIILALDLTLSALEAAWRRGKEQKERESAREKKDKEKHKKKVL